MTRMLRRAAAVLGCGLALLTGRLQAKPGAEERSYETLDLRSPVVEVPMLDAPMVTVEVRVNGQGPFRFELDTGAPGGGVISKALAEKLRLPKVGKVEIGDPSGKNRREVDVVRIGTLTVGDLTLHKIRAEVDDFERRPPEEKVDGVLGIGLFEELLLTLDYPRKRLRIERGALAAEGPGIVPFDNADGIPTLRMRIGDQEIETHVDSGNMAAEIVLPASLIGKIPLAAEPVVVGKARTAFNEFEIRQAPLAATVVIGGLEVPNPRVDFVDLFPFANLGHRFLRQFAVTIDQKAHRIRFQRP